MITAVLVGKKLVKEVMIYDTVRRDVKKGITPAHNFSSVNSKNRYNILTDINVKGQNIRPVEYSIFKECTDSPFFTVCQAYTSGGYIITRRFIHCR